MKTRRHVGKALVALVAAVAILGLGSTPASANDAEVTSGTLELFSSDSEQLHEQDLGDETASVECPGSNNNAVFNLLNTTTHSWNFTSNSHVAVVIAGTHFTVVMVVNSAGTSSTTGLSTGASNAVLTLTPNSSNGCGVVHGTPCTLTITGITVTGVHTMATSVTPSDTATINGDNGDHGDFGFEVVATGNCGALSAADDGSVTINNVVAHATT